MKRLAVALAISFALAAIALVGLLPDSIDARVADETLQPELVVIMFGSGLELHVQPGEVVLAELEHADGSKASGTGVADGRGVANVFFVPFGVGNVDTVVRPGDRLTLARFNQRPFTVDVPNLTADVDTESDRIVGTAPAHEDVALTIRYDEPTQVYTATATADANGDFALDLGGQVDLPEGATAGDAVVISAEGYRFVAQFVSFTGDVTIGARGMSGSATPGSRVFYTLSHPDGSESAATVEVTGGPSWSISVGSPASPVPEAVVQAGDTVSVTKSGGALGIDQTLAVTVPEITIGIDRGRNRVSGTAPADSALTVRASSLDGSLVSTETTTRPDGSYEVDLSPAADLVSGWRVRTAWHATPALTVGGLGVLPQARIGVHTARVRGLAVPGGRITTTLRSSSGQPKFTSVTYADDQGFYVTVMGGYLPGSENPIEPGDEIEIAYLAGDPLIETVPNLTARADDATNTVSGNAPVGKEVSVFVHGDPSAPVVTASVDDQGAYVADFGSEYQLMRPKDGTAIVGARDNVAFYTTWSAIQLNVQLAGDIVVLMANGAPGRAYEARLLDPDGQVVGTASGRAFDLSDSPEAVVVAGSSGFFYLVFTDITGDMVPVHVGDRIEIKAGDDLASLVVPPLDATVFVEEDIVAGRTVPSTTVTIVVQSASGQQAPAQATTDASGVFGHTYENYDIQYNDDVQLIAIIDGHVVIKYVNAPGLTLNLDTNVLYGTLPLDAGTKLRILLRRGEDALYDASIVSGTGGAFGAALYNDQGQPIDLEEGDRIIVQPTDPPGDAVAMDVPELTVEADAEADRVSGRATPGGMLVVLITESIMRLNTFPLSQAWPEIATSGSWTAEPVPSHDIQPGTVVNAQYRVPDGHVALRAYYVPLASVEHGSPNVCGYSQPYQPVSASLRNATGDELAVAVGRTIYDGRYQMVLADTDGALVNSEAGHTVQATLADIAAEVDVPVLDMNVDWSTGMLQGEGPADSLFYVFAPARRCLEAVDPLMISIFANIGQTEPDGTFTSFAMPSEPGQGFDVSFDTANGHRVYKQIYRALGQVYIERDRVTGITSAGADVSLVLAQPDGQVKGQATTSANANGNFDVSFGEEVVIVAGDVVTVTAAGDMAGITVEPLSFDWSPGDTIVGHATAGRALNLQLKLLSGRMLSVTWQVEPDGTFRFGAENVPPRADWSWGDVYGVRVVLKTPNLHEIISLTDGFEGPPPSPTTSIFLPYSQKGETSAVSASLGRLENRRAPSGAVIQPGPSVGGSGDARDVQIGGLRPFGYGTLGAQPEVVAAIADEPWAVVRQHQVNLLGWLTRLDATSSQPFAGATTPK